MRIGIIGAGHIGHALAVRFAAADHQVMLSNSRGPDTLTAVVASIQGDVRAGTVAEAVRFGEVVAVAIPLHAIGDLPPEPFASKLVVDANNYYPQRDGHIPELDADQTTSSELLASMLPGATVVKAFNRVFSSACWTIATRSWPLGIAWRSRSPATMPMPSGRSST
jgi:predicted dinucleotide-binding enzyme